MPITAKILLVYHISINIVNKAKVLKSLAHILQLLLFYISIIFKICCKRCCKNFTTKFIIIVIIIMPLRE